MIRETVIVLLALYATASNASQVADCKTGNIYENENYAIISACTKIPCILKRRTQVEIKQLVEPEEEIPSLTTKVDAKVLGLRLPFIGVDGTNACNYMYNVDGTKASCPLAKGKQYVYVNSFDVLPAYPRIDTVVHYALNNGKKDITCFEVPAKIVS